MAKLSRETLESLRTDFARDGVVCIRQAFDPDAIERLRRASEDVVANPDAHGNRGYMQGPMTAVNFLFRRPSPFRDFTFGSDAGEIIGRIIGATTIRMYHDYVFSKQPGCEKVVPWHTDGGGYAMRGTMMPNMWVALTPTDATNGRMEFITGFFREILSGRYTEHYAQPGQPVFPDFFAHQHDPDYPYRWVSWDLAPGDAVLFHASTPHHSKANTSGSTRTGYALRVIGDDVVWDKSKSMWLQIPGVSYDRVIDGAPVDDDEAFPLMWRDPEARDPAARHRAA